MLRNHHLRTLMRRGLAMVETDDFRVLRMIYDLGLLFGMELWQSTTYLEWLVSIKIRWDSLRLKKTTAAGASLWGLMPFCKSLTPKNQWKSSGALVTAGWCLHNDPTRAPSSEVPTCQGVIKRYQNKAVMAQILCSQARWARGQAAESGGLPGSHYLFGFCLQSPKPALLIVHNWESMLIVWNCYLSNCYGQRYIENMRYIHFLYCIEKCFYRYSTEKTSQYVYQLDDFGLSVVSSWSPC